MKISICKTLAHFSISIGAILSLDAIAATKITFKSDRVWESSRWYLLGNLESNQIKWVGSTPSLLTPNDPKKCLEIDKTPKTSKLTKSRDEVLINRDGWIALSIDPAKSTDTLELQYSNGCVLTTNVQWSVQAKKSKGVHTPYLFLKPQGNAYMGYEFDVQTVEAGEATDISLDVVAGAMLVNLGNSQPNAKTTLILAPFVEARGDWTPSGLGGLGFELRMLQTLSSLGGISGQNLLVNEWMAGTYFSHTFNIAQGLLTRLHFDFFQHLADQGTEVVSLGDYELDHKGFTTGLTLAQYFAKNWHIGLRGDYGFPSNLADRGAAQSFLSFRANIGYTINNTLSFLAEGAYRSYSYENHDTTTSMAGAMGIRLEL